MQAQSIKKSLPILLLLCYTTTFSQINNGFYNRFCTLNPIWSGDTTAFVINQAAQLQTRASTKAQTVAIHAPNNIAMGAKWEFTVELHFDPSPQNQVRIYLIADKSDFSLPLNGYFIQIGEQGNNDSYHLYLQKGTKIKKIIDGGIRIRPNPNHFIARIQVNRSTIGLWELNADDTGSTNYQPIGSIYDATFTTTTWLGIRCKYTASRSGSFIISNFTISPLGSPENQNNTYNMPAQPVDQVPTIHPEANYTDLTPNITPNDILISEILFNANKQSAPFIEIYNNSAHTLNLQQLSLATSPTSKQYLVSNQPLFINSKEYAVLTSQPNLIQQKWPNQPTIIHMPTLPPLNNTSGTIALISNSVVVDQLNYHENMHFQLLKNKEGISLERSSIGRATNASGNFKSAASKADFATPGYQNSQTDPEQQSATVFSLASKTFSPDNDGFEDQLKLNYQLAANNLITIDIFNTRGILIKKLINNETLSTQGTINWDGTTDNNTLAKPGIYIIAITHSDPNNHIAHSRIHCALTGAIK